MRAPVVAHGVFLLAAAGLAAYVWSERATPRTEAPVLLSGGIDDLGYIEYRWPDGRTHIVREGEGKARTYAVTLTRTYDAEAEKRKQEAMRNPDNRMAMKLGKSPDEIAAAAAAAGEPGERVTETQIFPPGLFTVATIQKLTPFRPRRSLGGMDGEAMRNMGLDSPQRQLVVSASGRELTLAIGNETYGGQAYYARQPGGDEVYLVEAETIRMLESTPANMMDSRIVTVPMSDVEGLEIVAQGRRAEFVHRNKDQFRARFFAPVDEPEQKSEALEGLMSTFVGLKADEFLGDRPSGPEILLIRFLRGDAAPHEVRLFRKANGGGYTIVSGRWVADLSEADGRKVYEEAWSALR